MKRKKYCKQCGQEYDCDRISCYCKNCLSQKKRNEMQQFYQQNGGWKKKLKWREKLCLIRIKIPTEEKWNTDFVPAVTEEVCEYCKEVHYDDQIYYHPYMKKAEAFGLNLEDLEELINEIKEEIREGKTTNECQDNKIINKEINAKWVD